MRNPDFTIPHPYYIRLKGCGTPNLTYYWANALTKRTGEEFASYEDAVADLEKHLAKI